MAVGRLPVPSDYLSIMPSARRSWPAIPNDLARRITSLNIEQALNIRKGSAIALSIYREMLEESPELEESQGDVADSIETAHLVTLASSSELRKRWGHSESQRAWHSMVRYQIIRYADPTNETHAHRFRQDLRALHHHVGGARARLSVCSRKTWTDTTLLACGNAAS
jgi:hypothetical protein